MLGATSPDHTGDQWRSYEDYPQVRSVHLRLLVSVDQRHDWRSGGWLKGATAHDNRAQDWTAAYHPLGYFKQEGNFVLIASNGGANRNPAWFYNLKSNPQVAIQVGNTQMVVQAEQAGSEKREQLWSELVKMAPTYRQYTQRTKREIPIVILQPV
jgi:deazaflavin-dependent oxidoreductase (nitroreductase family)